MKNDRPMKIKQKLILLMLGLTILSMLSAIGFIFFRDLAHFRRESINSIQTIANIAAVNTVAEIVFSDREEALRSLSQLQYLDDFVYVALFDKERQFLAGYPQDYQPDARKTQAELVLEMEQSDGFFRVMQPVLYKDETVGWIFLKFSSSSFERKVRSYLVDIAWFAVILVAFIIALTLKAQSLVSGPIVSLTDFIGKVSDKRDYSLRIQKSSSDEIGLLYDGFNNLLAVIEKRQLDLKLYQEHLEELVADRTRALSDMNAEMVKMIKAVEFSPNIVTILDSQGLVEYVNPKFEEVTGYKRADVIGRLATFMESGHHTAESYLEMRRRLNGGEDWSGEIIASRKNGSQYWEKISVSCVRDDNGRITHYIEVAEDSSARKAAETLERKAKEMAEKANRLKSEFLANMSHEIRTPMNAILGYAKLLMEGEKDEKRRHQLEIINISGENLLVIINDVLDFSKIEANKMELVLQSFSIRELLTHLEKMFSIKAKEKGLFMRIEIGSALPDRLYGDRNRLLQILINIISNAIKFTREGGVSVAVSYDERNVLHIAVKDSGVGIAEKDQAIILEPFTQADGSTTREFGGTGLGLTIAYKLLRLMGGDLDITSKVGVGSTFSVHVPLPEYRAEPADLDGGSGRPESVTVSLPRLALLVDQESDRRHLREVLGDGAYQLIELPADSDGVRSARQVGADLAINGLAAATVRRLDPAERGMPLVFCSGCDEADKTVHGGLFDFIERPVGDEHLAWLVAAIVSRRDRVNRVLVVDDQAEPAATIGALLKKLDFSVWSFSNVDEALTTIRNGTIPDLLILDWLLPEADGLRLWTELGALRCDIPVLVLTGPSTGTLAVQKTAGLLDSVRLPRQKFLSLIEAELEYSRKYGRAMVAGWLATCKGDDDLIDIVLSGMNGLPKIVARLGLDIASGRIDDIRFQAHSLKGLATNPYMEPVQRLSLQIDQEARKEDYDLLLIQVLFAELQAVVGSIPPDYLRDSEEPESLVQSAAEVKQIDILIAEDDPINQQLMRDYFDTRGLEVDLAENGHVVLDRIQSKTYHLLLLDMQMPVMDGMETIQKIRSEPRFDSLHVIALTGHAMRGDREKYLAAGCDDYLSKPINFYELQKKVDDQIQKISSESIQSSQ